ncbi:MAG: DUF3194 domain-containing protein [Candidatus Bathyarchaeia archaeon]
MEDSGIPELTDAQMEELCSTAEEAARKYVLSRLPSKGIKMLNVSAEAEGNKPLTLTVDVDITLTRIMKDYNAQSLVDGAVKEAFRAAEEYLREIKCRLQK